MQGTLMRMQLTTLALLSCIFWASSGCISRVEIDAMKDETKAIRQENAELRIAVQRIAAQAETMDRQWYSEKYCRSEKPEKNDKSDKGDKGERNFRFAAKIAEFIGEVEATVPEACTEVNLENSMTFMRTQAYANAFFRPTESVEAMHVARREYLLDLLAPKRIHPSTRLLVLVQPAEETETSRRAAVQLGEQFREMLRTKIAPQRELRILGPHLLPCRMRKEIYRIFSGPMDVTLPNEPKEGTPRVRIWLFLTDC